MFKRKKQKKYLVKGIEVLKTGTHIDSNGQASEVTPEVLTELAQSYDPEVHLAPVTYGHDGYVDDTAPAEGLIRKAYVVGDSLLLDLILPESTVSAIEDGRFIHRSLGYYEKGADYSPKPEGAYIQHMALLGSNPPAIKGLKPLVRVYSEKGTVNFAEAIIMEEEMDMAMPAEDTGMEVEDDGVDKVEVLNDNAGEWLRLLLSEGSKGFKGEIVAFDPPCDQASNWCYDLEGQAFKGSFIDEDELVYEFIIQKSGDSWQRGYKQKDGAVAPDLPIGEPEVAMMEPEVEMMEPETEMMENEVEMMEVEAEAPVDLGTEPEVMVDETEDEGEVEMAMPTEEVAVEEIDEVDAVEEVEEEDEDVTELGQMKKQLAEMQAQLDEFKEKQYMQMAKKLYAEGKLTEGIVPEAELVRMFAELNRLNQKSPQVVTFSEGTKTTVFDFVANLLDKLPAMVTFGEMGKPGLNKTGLVKDAMPIVPAYSEMNPDDITAYSEIIAFGEKMGLDMKKRGNFEKAMKEKAKCGS